MTRFEDLGLDERLLRALRDADYAEPTPIQAQAIPHLLQGRDLLGSARTGTGKTAAFALPILQRLAGEPRGGVAALVVVPTRELATQVGESFREYGRHLDVRVAVLYGGVPQGSQVKQLRAGADVVVATPGRLLDLMGQGHADLSSVRVLVLDESDQMLDMGFLPDVKRLVAAVPERRQTMLFSATMPKPIEELAGRLLRDPARVAVSPPASTVDLVRQEAFVVQRLRKPGLLAGLLCGPGVESALVFVRTRHGADRIAKRLSALGIPAQAIHGDKMQALRERILKAFRTGKVRVLVATDVAARGLDIEGLSHVVNYDLPQVPETYVHRIGRTGRAGASGIAFSLVAEDDLPLLEAIEKTIGRSIPLGDTEAIPDPRARPKPAPPARTSEPKAKPKPKAPAPPAPEGRRVRGATAPAAARPAPRPAPPAAAARPSARPSPAVAIDDPYPWEADDLVNGDD